MLAGASLVLLRQQERQATHDPQGRYALSPALGIGAFTELTLVDAGQAVKVDPAARPEAASLVGCGVMAGLGAALNTGAVSRGDSVAVIGCGGVGDAAIAVRVWAAPVR